MIAASPLLRADPSALWNIVHGQCVPGEEHTGKPDPCASVALGDGGYALLKDRRGISQYLLIPTARLGGIESPELLAANAPNYWDPAWKARALVAARLDADVARDKIALAINSATGRSQDQLHIHIDCVRQDVFDALKQHAAGIGDAWSKIALPPDGHNYLVRRLEQEELGAADPFKLVAEQGPDVREHMAAQTIAVIGASFSNGRQGFYLLNDHVSLAAGDPASAEELQDHDCAIVKKAP